MKNVINLHDVSPYIYTGMNARDLQNYKFQGFPMGGIKYLLKNIALDVSSGNHSAFFFDEGRSFRKDLWPEYKASRKGKASVDIVAQMEIVKELLQLCNLRCYSVKNLEADDLIYSACVQNKNEYISLAVHTADYDLAHNVDRKTKFVAVNSNVNNLTANTFGSSIIAGEFLPLNTISAHKVFFGCSSDEVVPFRSGSRLSNEELFQGFVTMLEANKKDGIINLELARHPQALKLYVRDHPGLTEEDKELLYLRVDVIFPRLHVEGIRYEASSVASIGDEGRWNLAKLLLMCDEPQYVRRLGFTKFPQISDKDKEFFSKKAISLSTGEFAVDRGLNLDRTVTSSQLEVSRDFDW